MRLMNVFLLGTAAVAAIIAAIIRCRENNNSNDSRESTDTANELLADRLVVDALTPEDLRSWAEANSNAAVAVRHVIAVPTQSVMQQIGCKRELHLDPSHSAIQMVVPKNESDASLLRFRLIQFNSMYQPLQLQLMNSQSGVVILEFDT